MIIILKAHVVCRWPVKLFVAAVIIRSQLALILLIRQLANSM